MWASGCLRWATLNLTSTVTAGIVSTKGRNLRLLEPDAKRDIYPVESFLQTDAAVNPGNSGGALVNLEGKLIGINTAIASQAGSYAGYSFAIPSSIVRKVVDDLREFGRVQRAYLGIKSTNAIRVSGGFGVFRGSGASEAGLQPGDRIESIDGIPVSTSRPSRAVVQTPSRRTHCGSASRRTPRSKQSRTPGRQPWPPLPRHRPKPSPPKAP